MKNKVGGRSERGAILVVSLIILLILTILGVSVMHTTTLEEKMAAATRDKDLALQAAETALRAAEDYLAVSKPNSDQFSDTCNAGRCTVAAGGVPRWEDPNICSTDSVWNGGCSVELTGAQTIQGVDQQPRYIIEFLKASGGALNNPMVANLGDFPKEKASIYYRITALGYGGSPDSQVMLQSTFGI